MRLLFWAGLGGTLYMTGVVWFAQSVHYPLLDRTPPPGFPDFARAYQARTFRIVLLPMTLEGFGAVILPFLALPEGGRGWAWAALGLAVLIWVSTAAIQIPQHRALAQGYNAGLHRRLVRANWVRTAAWSARSLILLWLASRRAGG